MGPRGGVKDDVLTVRRMGATQYGRGENIGKFGIPTKHGLYANFLITENNVQDVHAWDDCPIGLPANILVKDLVADLVANCPQRKSVDNPTWDTDYFD